MECPLAEIVVGWKKLTKEEIEVARNTPGIDLPQDLVILYVLKNMSLESRKDFYESFHILTEHYDHFKNFQDGWMKMHQYFVGKDLESRNEDSSHAAVGSVLLKEILRKDGEAARCNVFYGIKYPERLKFRDGREDSGRIQIGGLRELYDFACQNQFQLTL